MKKLHTLTAFHCGLLSKELMKFSSHTGHTQGSTLSPSKNEPDTSPRLSPVTGLRLSCGPCHSLSCESGPAQAGLWPRLISNPGPGLYLHPGQT